MTTAYPCFDTDEKRWKARLAFVDMYWKTTHKDRGGGSLSIHGYIHRNGGGLSSRGSGETIGDAIRNASTGQNIDWDSVDRKISAIEWRKIAHE